MTASTSASTRGPTSVPRFARWLGAGAAVVGRGHLRTSTPCQDAVAIVERGDAVAAVLADGAGSASRSHDGARAVVDAVGSFLVGQADSLFEDNDAVADRVLEVARAALVMRAMRLGCRVEDLACTLLFVLARGDRWLAGQVGDGVIARRDGVAVDVVFAPVRGPFLNTTVFVTSVHARETMQVRAATCGVDAGFALMSDGSAESLHRRADNHVAPAVARLVGALDVHAPTTVTAALEQNITQVLRERTLDDCSVAVLRRCGFDDVDDDDRGAALLGRAHRRDRVRRATALACAGLERASLDEVTRRLGCSRRQARRERAWVRSVALSVASIPSLVGPTVAAA